MKSVLILVMRISRKILRGTWFQQLAVTTFIYKKIANFTFGSDSQELEFRGCKYRYPGGDFTTLPTLMDGSYERHELNLLESLLENLEEPITAIDIGANIGIWTILLAKHPNIRHVISFEPSAQNLEFLYVNLEINNVLNKVTVVGSAVSNVNGELNFNDQGNGATRHLSPKGSITVPVVTLDHYLGDSRVGIIKIDVEGSEPNVLEGAWGTITEHSPILFIEYSQLQVSSAELSWAEIGPRLCNFYGGFRFITNRLVQNSQNFADLNKEKRLLNLVFHK